MLERMRGEYFWYGRGRKDRRGDKVLRKNEGRAV
jgi:hypothetical protein